MNIDRKIADIGPGGYKCHCCGPAPSQRSEHRRLVRRRLNQMVAREIEEQLIEVEEDREFGADDGFDMWAWRRKCDAEDEAFERYQEDQAAIARIEALYYEDMCNGAFWRE